VFSFYDKIFRIGESKHEFLQSLYASYSISELHAAVLRTSAVDSIAPGSADPEGQR
jgi:hypothetical protein